VPELSDAWRSSSRPRAAARRLARPPSGLLDRVRWLFLIFGLLTIGPLGTGVVARSHAGWSLRLLAVAGLVSLAVFWVAAFRQGRLTNPATAAAEALALLPVALAAEDPAIALGLAFAGTFYHALVGQPRQVALRATLYYLAVAGAAALRGPGVPMPMLVQAPGLIVAAALAYLLGDTLRRQERAVARERVLSQVGTALFLAPDPAAIARTAVATAQELLERAERTQVSLVELVDDELVAVAVDGDGLQGTAGARLPLDAVPAPLQVGFRERRTVYAEDVDDRRAKEAVDYQVEVNAALVLPLPASDGLHGALAITSDRPIPGEVRDALEALRAQVTLALERAALTAELTRRASYDELTGLANRSVLHEHLRQALAAPADGGILALLLLDLDDFKTINDSLGHSHGDQVLVVVAERLRACLRAGDLAARLGGDEFAVLLRRVAGEVEAVGVAERLVESLREPVAVSGREVQSKASVGIRVARRGSGGQDPDELLRDADVAMYAAKAGGRGTVRVFDATMHTRAVQRLDFEADLRRAVIEQQFTVRYQPVIELAGGQLAGLEALVRWDHPGRGLVMPGEFVTMAEDTGLIIPIGRWVLHAACQAARDWQRRFPLARPPFISVNRSVRQLQRPDLLEDVAGALDASGLDPTLLMLEITESVLVVDEEAIIERLRGLRGLGVHLAVDDFGTGYSSLAYLRRLPVDTLKLAKPFVDGVTRGVEQAALAHAILRMADVLGLTVVAEGIEQEAQAQALEALGCRYGQGFYFARPLDQFAVESLLLAERQRRAATPIARSAG
jgi:diguanylate cyclase (GGDEF)-like protein